MNRKTPPRILVCVAIACLAAAADAAGQGITVTPASPTITAGQTQQFAAPEASNAADVVAGDYHACVLLQSGEARCVGYNFMGQLGNGTLTDSSRPVPVLQIAQAAGVTTGGFHSCAVLLDGTVKCWGQNDVGQLGDGTTTNSSTPVTVSGITSAIAVAAGYKHTCALGQDGSVRCWGDNSYGELGDGNAVLQTQRGGPSTAHSSSPVSVVGINTAVAITASDGYHSCAVLQNGTVKCWGDNSNGQLGDGSRTTAVTPVSVAGITAGVAVSSGDFHTCALIADGTIGCWGLNFSGQLGDGTGWDSNTPVQVSGISTATAVSVGVIHTCAVLADGTARCWGYNSNGQLGDGTTSNRNAPVVVSGVATAIGAVAAGNNDSCVLLQGGVVKCWGMNTYGELGIGTTADAGTPTTVVGINATWTSSNPAVATIDASGLATANVAGSTTITATLDGRSGSTTLTVSSPVRTITVNKAGAGHGSVIPSAAGLDCGLAADSCTASYSAGTALTLTASAAAGSRFDNWSGCDSANAADCSLTLDTSRSVVPTFRLQFVLTVSKTGIGSGTVTSSPAGINCGSTCSAAYDGDTVVTLTATPAMLSVFNGWTGCDSASGSSCTVSLSAAKSVTANFLGVPLP
jgi:alpha-tubulin suppressor-like RCC1 family protein